MLAPSTRGRGLSLRITLLLVTLGAGAYAAALPLHLFFRVSRPALALGAATEAITLLGEDLARRDSALDQVLAIAHTLARSPAPARDSLKLAHRLLARGGQPVHLAANAPIPDTLRSALTRIDAALSRVE